MIKIAPERAQGGRVCVTCTSLSFTELIRAKRRFCGPHPRPPRFAWSPLPVPATAFTELICAKRCVCGRIPAHHASHAPPPRSGEGWRPRSAFWLTSAGSISICPVKTAPSIECTIGLRISLRPVEVANPSPERGGGTARSAVGGDAGRRDVLSPEDNRSATRLSLGPLSSCRQRKNFRESRSRNGEGWRP